MPYCKEWFSSIRTPLFTSEFYSINWEKSSNPQDETQKNVTMKLLGNAFTWTSMQGITGFPLLAFTDHYVIGPGKIHKVKSSYGVNVLLHLLDTNLDPLLLNQL